MDFSPTKPKLVVEAGHFYMKDGNVYIGTSYGDLVCVKSNIAVYLGCYYTRGNGFGDNEKAFTEVYEV